MSRRIASSRQDRSSHRTPNVVRGIALAVGTLLVGTGNATAQGGGAPEAYYRAVAEFFQLPRSEISILSDWHLPAQEIPVVLFIARRAGVSAEALVALRRSGQGWQSMAGRYRVDASHMYVPLPEGAPAGRLEGAYGRYRSTPPGSWSSVTLGDQEILDLVNLRLLAQVLHMAPETVLRQAGSGSWDEIYARLLGRETR